MVAHVQIDVNSDEFLEIRIPESAREFAQLIVDQKSQTRPSYSLRIAE